MKCRDWGLGNEMLTELILGEAGYLRNGIPDNKYPALDVGMFETN